MIVAQHESHSIRRALSIGVVALAVLSSSFVAPTQSVAAPVPPSEVHVVIDPGHGGAYPGAVYGGVKEALINLSIARRLASELESRGYRVSMTRWTDTMVHQGANRPTWDWVSGSNSYQFGMWPVSTANDRLRQDLQARCDIANRVGADLFVSIHNNAGPSTAHGAETYRAPNDPLGQQFATDLQTELVAASRASNRGAKVASFYVLRWTNMPAVLAEIGFMSNPAELSRLTSASYQQSVARGLANGIDRFSGRPVEESWTRYWGRTRYDTAAAVSRAGWNTAPAVVLASGETFADSLVAAPLAARLGGPILLTRPDVLPQEIASEIRRLAPGRIVVVGGPLSVSDAVARGAATAAGLDPTAAGSITRFGGRTRYDVAVVVARELGVDPSVGVVVASGDVFPDALGIAASAAARGEPILLASANALPDGARQIIGVAGGQVPVTVVGGPVSLPDSLFSGLTYRRLSGQTRYDTNWAILAARYTPSERLRPVIVSAERFPDALVVGPLAAKQGRPILLVGKTAVPTYVREWVYANRQVSIEPVVAGGPSSVSAYLSKMFDKWKMNAY